MIAREEFVYRGGELDAMAGAVRYHRSIRDSFAGHLRGDVVEVGAGVGSFALRLLEASPASLTLIEPARDNLRRLRARMAGIAGVRVLDGYLEEWAERLSADAVVAVNVLEHVEDDEGFLRAAHAALRPEGALLLYVPALPALFGTLDEAFDHHRRYTRSGLREKVEGAGFTIRRLSYANLPGVLAWFAAGRLLRRRTLDPRAVALYDRWVTPWVARLESRWPPLVGQNLLCVARR